MSRLSASLFLSLLIISPNPSVSAAESNRAAEPPLAVQIRLYDHVHLSAETMAEAQEVASFILLQAGVETVWLRCPTETSDVADRSACKGAQGSGDLVIRVLTKEMVEKVKAFKGFYGFAWLASEGRFARVASVFHHRIAALARDEGYSKAVLLGHFMAHEMGHLLLGLGSHSRNGLMRHPWRTQELKRAVRGTLRFTPEQSRRIREDVQARLESAPQRSKLRAGDR